MDIMEFVICFTPQHIHLHVFCVLNALCIEIYCFFIFPFTKILITMFFQESCICKVSNHSNSCIIYNRINNTRDKIIVTLIDAVPSTPHKVEFAEEIVTDRSYPCPSKVSTRRNVRTLYSVFQNLFTYECLE